MSGKDGGFKYGAFLVNGESALAILGRWSIQVEYMGTIQYAGEYSCLPTPPVRRG